MIQVQKFLTTTQESTKDIRETLKILKETFGIDSKEYPEDNLILLDYGIDSPKIHEITIECRSLILNYDFEIVSRKFDRFFNYGEAPELYHNFDYASATVMEKADGSLIGVYYNPHRNIWEISTRGLAKAEGQNAYGSTFREFVLKAFGVSEEDFQEFFKNFSGDFTYIFEYTSPFNRIVTPYKTDSMVLLGIRHNASGEFLSKYQLEYYIENFKGLNVRLTNFYEASDIDGILKISNDFENLEEGLVVWEESTGRRIKIKNTVYLTAHRLRGNGGVPRKKDVASLVLTKEDSEFLAYFPEYSEQFEDFRKELQKLFDNIQEVWDNTKNIESQKEFALSVSKYSFSSVLFFARKTNSDPIKEFWGLELTKQLKYFGEL